jgi:hypothetical protein
MDNSDLNPMQTQLPMHLSPRCGAHSRRTGKPCRNPAMKNGSCGMHGGKSPPDCAVRRAKTHKLGPNESFIVERCGRRIAAGKNG